MGTPQPISLRDTDLGLVRLRAFGQYTIQVMDPKRFVDQIVGVQSIYTTSQIEDYLRNAVVSRLTDLLGENMTSIFDLPRLFDEIAAGMRAKVQEDFAAMGIALKQFMIVSINPTDETAKAIDERASMGAIGNIDAYMKFKTARAIGDAAQQPGGGSGEGLGLGAGIGMGAGMAGMIANAMSGVQQANQAPAGGTPAATPSVMTLEEAAAYLRVSPADVQAILDSGEIRAKKIGTQYRISKEAIDAYLNG
ncbi:MAG: SPFH domain-containing protein [Caldilineaceae bacterium]